MKTGKIVLVVVGVVVVVGAVAVWYLMRKADQDTANITQLKEQKMSSEEVSKLAEKPADFRTVMQAAQQAGELDEGKRLELWKTQLAADNAAVKMKAAQELMKMEGAGAAELLEQLSKDEKQDAELKLQVQRHLAGKALKGKEGADALGVAAEMLADPRPGFRMAALEVLSKDKSPSSIEKVKKAAESDSDENVKLMAEMTLEEMTGEDQDSGEEEE